MTISGERLVAGAHYSKVFKGIASNLNTQNLFS